jgi:predicted Zn-dependent peptidase
MFATYFDDPARINSELDRYRAVTVDDVTAFARRTLVPSNRASLLYTPRGTIA